MITIDTRLVIIEEMVSCLFFLLTFIIFFDWKLIRKAKFYFLFPALYVILFLINTLTNLFLNLPFILIMYLTLKPSKDRDYYLLNSIILSLLLNDISTILSSAILSGIYSIYKLTDLSILIILLSLILIILIFSIFLLLKLGIKNRLKKTDSFILSSVLIYLYTVMLVFMYFVKRFEAYTSLISGILIFLFIQVIFIILLATYAYRRQKESFEKKLMIDQLENLKQYTQQLDSDQREMHKFRHDYKNILNSLNEIAETNNNDSLKNSLTELEGYSNSYFNNISMDDFKGLEYISNSYIKSIIISKLKIIRSKNIACYFECRSYISSVNIEIFDLVRILGILIDNAIEAVEIQKQGKISIILIEEHGNFDAIIKNTVSEPISISQINNHGFTTKKNHSGFGLENIQDIKKKYSNLLINHKVTNDLFSVQISITKQGDSL